MLDLTDWQNKKYQTRDGRQVRILCIDAKDEQPVIGLITTKYGEEPEQWSIDGTYNPELYEDGSMDLINAKTKHEGWVNIYPDSATSGFLYKTKEEADGARSPNRIACIHIEWEK